MYMHECFHCTNAYGADGLIPSWLSSVKVTFTGVESSLSEYSARGVLWQAALGRFLINIPSVAGYLIEDGLSVSIDIQPGATSSDVSRHFRMAPLASLVYQREMLALHASAVCNDKGVVLLAGASGAGKSSLLITLVSRGFRMLSDELSVIGCDDSGQLHVLPTYPDIDVWPNTLDFLGLQTMEPSVSHYSRQVLSCEKNMVFEAKPLLAIYWLGITKKGHVELTEVTGSDKFQAVNSFIYNSYIADVLVDRMKYLQLASSLSSAVPIKKLQRYPHEWSLYELADIVEREFK